MICRDKEQEILSDLLKSKRAEFLAIYGRRRVGKTFLIREFFKKQSIILFSVAGSKEGNLTEQISHFTKVIGDTFYNGVLIKESKSWDQTFALLTKAIKDQPLKKKIVLFFDEFPWMATPKSRLLQSLDYYWNQYWSQNKNIKLVICGSSASWIINHIVNNTGGLHNRITKQILLEPLDLHDTKQFLEHQGIKLNNKQVVELYMLTGGIPYYLTHIKKGLSVIQNIEMLGFTKKGLLIDEFNNLFSSLFNGHEICIEMIRIIASKKYGIGQEELFKKINKNIKGKSGLQKLKEMEDAGFIISFKPYLHKEKGIYYQVIDEYTLFYLKWIEPVRENLLKSSLSHGYWETQQNSSAWYSWAGLAYEAICYKHLRQIRQALKLSPTAIPHTWRYVPTKKQASEGTQIDLLFDRDDDAITLCEIKFTDKPFIIDKQYAKNLLKKKEVFVEQTKTKKQIFMAMITSNGIKDGVYADKLIDSIISLNELFKNT